MRSITKTPSGDISARATSIPKNGAIESWITSSRFMRNVPFTLVGPLPFKSTANDIFAVIASHPGERLISSSIYSDSDKLKNLAKADLDFHTLQALFMNEIFLPGKKVLTVRDISSFAVRPENENALIEVKNGKHFAYRFRTNTNDGLLKESHIGLSGTRYGINWRYDKFRPLEQKQFPGTMTVSFEGAAKPVTAVFELSRLSTNKDWEAHTEVPGKYERIELQDLLKQLIK